MKICAVICEYNPFHSGHLYQLGKIPAGYDRIACVMSGNFVQRAEPAIVDKYLRAETALRCGADIVVENPILYATASGEKFAEGAIKVISAMKDVKGLIMSCECDDPSVIEAAANVQYEESDDFKSDLKNALDRGIAYASALCQATVNALSGKFDAGKIKAALSEPNNLLCVEYIKSIRRGNLNIKPIIIKRKGNGYNDLRAFGDYLSASAIRDLLASATPLAASPYLPENDSLYKAVRSGKTADSALYNAISLYNLRNSTHDQLEQAFDCREGLQYPLIQNAKTCNTLTEALEKTKSKRYTFARLKRIVLQNNLSITKDAVKKAENQTLPFRVLACKNDFKGYFSQIEKNAVIRNSDYDKFSSFDFLFDIERRASALYSVVTHSEDNYMSEKLICDKLP